MPHAPWSPVIVGISFRIETAYLSHTPITFHHSPPTPSQTTMFTALSRAPSLHYAPIATYPDPTNTGAAPWRSRLCVLGAILLSIEDLHVS